MRRKELSWRGVERVVARTTLYKRSSNNSLCQGFTKGVHVSPCEIRNSGVELLENLRRVDRSRSGLKDFNYLVLQHRLGPVTTAGHCGQAERQALSRRVVLQHAFVQRHVATCR